MPRTPRVDIRGEIYHVINRTNGRFRMFTSDREYCLFEKIVIEGQELFDMKILAYVFMPNHWHFMLQPKNDGDLSKFMHQITNTHTRKVHAFTETEGNGHLYQGRYKSFLVSNDTYAWTLLRYIERNPVRAGLTEDPFLWRWGSAHVRVHMPASDTHIILSDLPSGLPQEYLSFIREKEKPETLERIRLSVKRECPYGVDSWVSQMIEQHKLEATIRNRGRPKKY